jgi:hypothetical protein
MLEPTELATVENLTRLHISAVVRMFAPKYLALATALSIVGNLSGYDIAAIVRLPKQDAQTNRARILGGGWSSHDLSLWSVGSPGPMHPLLNIQAYGCFVRETTHCVIMRVNIGPSAWLSRFQSSGELSAFVAVERRSP